MIRTLIREFSREFRGPRTLAHVRTLAQLDRYQASLGIEQAADYVAEAARAIGLTDVRVEYHASDGRPQWWTFAAPMSWTPTCARLEVRGLDGRALLELDHATSPLALATYSAPTAAAGLELEFVRLRGPGSIAGAVVLMTCEEYGEPRLLAELSSAGALGFVTDAVSRPDSDGTSRRGRIELRPTSDLFAFSLTKDEFAAVAVAAEESPLRARVEIHVDRLARMPVVTGLLPGRGREELWLTSHLCHPRPGANDNASGVAALLEIAAMHIAVRERRASAPNVGIRFWWGPEFLGAVAALHGRVGPGRTGSLPIAVLNLDMVGEDQSLCRCPFLVERPPDIQPSMLAPLSEHVVEAVFEAAPGQRWRAIPFAGFSDHSLFADPSIARPAVQFCHVPDAFNHSAADTIDKVSESELARSATAAAVLAEVLTREATLPAAYLEQLLSAWIERERAGVDSLVRSLPAGPDTQRWGSLLVDHVNELGATLRKQINSTIEAPSRRNADRVSEQPITRCWSGPLNVRAMLAATSTRTRSEIDRLARADKRVLSLLLNFGIRIDGVRGRDEIIRHTSLSIRRPLEAARSRRLFDALLESGWARIGP